MNGTDLHERAGISSRLLYLPLYAGALALSMGIGGMFQAASAQNKIVTVVLSEEPEGLDGCNSNRSTVGRVAKQNIVETLTEIDPKDGSITPRLALSWTKVDEKMREKGIEEESAKLVSSLILPSSVAVDQPIAGGADQSVPFDDGTPCWRGSMAMACRRARAVPLKTASAM